MSKGWLAGLLLAAVTAGTVALPKPAEAYWVRDGYRWVWRAPVVYVPGPVVVAAPPVRHWVPPHYNRYGYFVPGHWA
jgi:hypothetical protein